MLGLAFLMAGYWVVRNDLDGSLPVSSIFAWMVCVCMCMCICQFLPAAGKIGNALLGSGARHGRLANGSCLGNLARWIKQL